MILGTAVEASLVSGVDFLRAAQASGYYGCNFPIFYTVSYIELFNTIDKIHVIQLIRFLHKTPDGLRYERQFGDTLIDISIGVLAILKVTFNSFL